MKAAVAVLQPAIDAAGGGRQTLGSAVAGTVAGDIHEIGKTIVCSMLSAAGFMSPTSAATCRSRASSPRCRAPPDLLLLSALLTTTMPNQQKTIEALKEAGLREGVKVMIGGAPTTRAWADEIGADGYAEDAIEAVATAKSLRGSAHLSRSNKPSRRGRGARGSDRHRAPKVRFADDGAGDIGALGPLQQGSRPLFGGTALGGDAREPKLPTRLGDGSLVEMTRSEIKTDLEDGTAWRPSAPSATRSPRTSSTTCSTSTLPRPASRPSTSATRSS